MANVTKFPKLEFRKRSRVMKLKYTGPELVGEVWKTVPCCKVYEVSNLGRLRSKTRIVRRKNRWGNEVDYVVRSRLLKPHSSDDKQYVAATLSNNKKMVYTLVHRLVLEAFVGPCPNGMECCHEDGKPGNNRLNNLRWGTSLSNHDDRRRHGTIVRGEKNASAKLTESKVRRMRRLWDEGKASLNQLMVQFGMSKATTYQILIRKLWRHVV